MISISFSSKLKKIPSDLFLILVIATLTGCGAIEHNRVRASVLSDPLTPESIKSSVKENKITIGMTKEQVVAAWGNPCGYCYGTRENSHGSVWEYNPFGTGRYSIGAGTYLYFGIDGKLRYWTK